MYLFWNLNSKPWYDIIKLLEWESSITLQWYRTYVGRTLRSSYILVKALSFIHSLEELEAESLWANLEAKYYCVRMRTRFSHSLLCSLQELSGERDGSFRVQLRRSINRLRYMPRYIKRAFSLSLEVDNSRY